jgi:hypothetical protein
MLEGVLEVLEGTEEHPRICGWINLPEGSIPERLRRRAGGIEICEARPAGINEPTAKVVDGTKEILRLIDQATSEDVVLFLLSGGGSAGLEFRNSTRFAGRSVRSKEEGWQGDLRQAN